MLNGYELLVNSASVEGGQERRRRFVLYHGPHRIHNAEQDASRLKLPIHSQQRTLRVGIGFGNRSPPSRRTRRWRVAITRKDFDLLSGWLQGSPAAR